MKYTVQQLARLAGVSGRTLRYYDKIGLLKPAGLSPAGYRLYGRAEVDRLQQILFYRALGVNLKNINKILADPGFDRLQALQEHREKLLEQREQLSRLIANVDKSISMAEGRTTMTDKEKFEGFKQKLVLENEKNFGREARERYGDEAVDRSNARVLSMSEEQYAEAERLSEEVLEALQAAIKTGDPAGETAQKAARLHHRWLSFFWDHYTREAHAALAQLYVDEPRFTAVYDAVQPGAAAFLRDAILHYTGINKAEE